MRRAQESGVTEKSLVYALDRVRELGEQTRSRGGPLRLRFVKSGVDGYVSGSPEIVQALCDLWNCAVEGDALSEAEELIAALAFYGDPETYHAIAFAADPPCGEFADDFSEDHGHEDYDRPMPGAKARITLREFVEKRRPATTQ